MSYLISYIRRLLPPGLFPVKVNLLLTIILLSASASAYAEEFFITMLGGQFKPQTLTIKKGDTVTWMNDDDYTHHDVTFEDRHLRGPDEDPKVVIKYEKSFSFTFTRTGTFRYYCHSHKDQDMKGIVVVE